MDCVRFIRAKECKRPGCAAVRSPIPLVFHPGALPYAVFLILFINVLLLRLVQAFVVNIEKVEYFKDASTGQALALSCIYLTNKLINVALNAEIAYMASNPTFLTKGTLN